MTELALSTPLREDQREYLTMVQTSSGSLSSIINDILDFSKMEAGKLSLDAAEFHPFSVIEEALRIVTVPAHQKGSSCYTGTVPPSSPFSLAIRAGCARSS